MLKLNYTVASDRGLVRGNNEDSAYAGPHLLVLADGMGGHAAGEIASQLMVEHLRVLDADPGDNDMLALLGTVADDANQAIAAGVRANPETDGMGTTCTTLLFDGTQFGMLHVGDSRGYRLRDGALERITRDDTYVQALVDEGELDAEDVSTHPQRSLILKAYTGRPVEPTLELLDAQVGDRLLLCSDGLSDPVTHSTIESTLNEGTPAEAAARLIELALRSGGPDNVTIVIADVVDTDSFDETALPTTPEVGGALNGDQPEDPRPNTAAGRAAVLQDRQSRTIEPQPEPTSPTPPSPGEGNKSNGKWLGALITVLVFLALAGVGVWGYNHMSNNFYVATKDEALVIEQGADYAIFGKELHHTYQQACLDKEGRLKVVDMQSSDCEPFKKSDLQPDARAQVEAKLPGGSYDEVMQQMTTLSTSVLPVCVVREGTEASASAAGDLNTPGVNCREVR
ncbi:PP2C family protein-serine/threonine phosphatase [Corynebacterium epidermidicanis]|uniref:Serine/threonine protein phosphatase n=1 Tax=Corynebacterium epidermidicanis TaxID=1050174 RepID=A0A0G3GQU8_9CORY|nr:protein phosphatase 2C domain-containing protein [Corynebacterium epidermidicanis]AKK01938.1 serine/threonine protein phosphatase [Corynebacterium epidermidicanis]